MTQGKLAGGLEPRRLETSVKFTPAALMSTRACPGPGCGIGDVLEEQHVGGARLVYLDSFHFLASNKQVSWDPGITRNQ